MIEREIIKKRGLKKYHKGKKKKSNPWENKEIKST